MSRDEHLSRLDQEFDVLVIGGGASGLGVALDSASRGYSTALLEARDFAQGTSSRSTKLAHGGVRYLQQGNLKLVREALHERGRLMRNAPHLVHERRFLVPAYRWWHLPFYGIGLKLYDLLAGQLNLAPAHVVGVARARRLVPTIQPRGLRGGVLYSDAQFDDARLAIILARTAASLGSVLVNYAPVTSLVQENGRVVGVVVTDSITSTEYRVRARAVVNATGPFADSIRRMDDPDAPPIIAVSRGTHLVLGRRFLPGDTAMLIPRTDDGRVIFIIPWNDHTLVGTTDVPVSSSESEPSASEAEIDFILKHAGTYLELNPRREDVRAVFSGLRPLVKPPESFRRGTAEIGRDHAILVSDSQLVTITGGKWTTYRLMAEQTVDRVIDIAGLPPGRSQTADLRLIGADGSPSTWSAFAATDAQIAAYESRFPGQLHPELPYSRAMVAFVVDHEIVVRLEDVLSRRLRALVLNARAAVAAAPDAARIMAELQGHDSAWVAAQVTEFSELAARHYMLSSAIPS